MNAIIFYTRHKFEDLKQKYNIRTPLELPHFTFSMSFLNISLEATMLWNAHIIAETSSILNWPKLFRFMKILLSFAANQETAICQQCAL